MVQVCVRRHSDSQFSRAIHEAIKKVCYQKQCPNEERILRFVLREFDWKACDISKQLRLAVKDGLFRETIAISHKGSKKGNEQQSFRINLTLDAVDADGNSQLKEVNGIFSALNPLRCCPFWYFSKGKATPWDFSWKSTLNRPIYRF